MIYCATPNTSKVRDTIAAGQLGAMLTPDSWPQLNDKVSERFPWVALDNGCFSDKWNESKWWAWLKIMQPRRPECLFAVCPDVVGDHDATLKRWYRYAEGIKSLGYPAAFVLQDGASKGDVPWSDIDALFIGGSTDFKLSETAWEMVTFAKTFGLHTHMGRVNSFNRIRACARAGVDSVDGTYLAFGPDANLPKLMNWLTWIEQHPTMGTV